MDLPCQWTYLVNGWSTVNMVRVLSSVNAICTCFSLTNSAAVPSRNPTMDMHRYTLCSACEFTQVCPKMTYPPHHSLPFRQTLHTKMGDGVYRFSYSSMHTHTAQLEISFTYSKVISDVDISSLVDKVSYCIMRTFLNCQVQGSVLFKRHYHKYTAGCKPIAKTVAY